MASIEVNGITIEYTRRGQGPPVLFVMGLGGQLVDWPEEFLDAFVAAGYEVIAFDNRDIGLSTKTEWNPPSILRQLVSHLLRRPIGKVGYTLTDMAGDAAGLIDGLGLESAHVVGISMGGMIGQELAIEHPEKVRSLCSIMSNTGDRKNGGIAASLLAKLRRARPPARETAVEQGAEWFALISGPHFDVERYREVAVRSVERSFSPDGVARQTAAVAGSRDRTALLGAIDAPVLVVHGLVDPLVKVSGGIATAEAIPSSRLLLFPDMGHDLPRPRWGELVDAVVANAQRADRPADRAASAG